VSCSFLLQFLSTTNRQSFHSFFVLKGKQPVMIHLNRSPPTMVSSIVCIERLMLTVSSSHVLLLFLTIASSLIRKGHICSPASPNIYDVLCCRFSSQFSLRKKIDWRAGQGIEGVMEATSSRKYWCWWWWNVFLELIYRHESLFSVSKDSSPSQLKMFPYSFLLCIQELQERKNSGTRNTRNTVIQVMDEIFLIHPLFTYSSENHYTTVFSNNNLLKKEFRGFKRCN